MKGYGNYKDYGSMWGPQTTPKTVMAPRASEFGRMTGSPTTFQPTGYARGVPAGATSTGADVLRGTQYYGTPSMAEIGQAQAMDPTFGSGDPIWRPDTPSAQVAIRPQPQPMVAGPGGNYANLQTGQYTGATPLPTQYDPNIATQDQWGGYGQTIAQPDKPNLLERQWADLKDTRLGRGVSQGVDYITDPESITGGIIEDYGTGRGLLKLAAIDALTPDYTGEREHERTLNEAREELERQEWEFKRVLTPEETGFGQTYVVVDPSGVEYNLTEAEILDIAYGRRARPKLTPSYRFNPERFVPTKHGGGLGSLIHRQGGDQIGTPDVVGDIRDSLENEFINDLKSMTPKEFETKYNMTMQEGHNQLKVMFPHIKPGDWNELFSGRALQPLPKQPLPDLPPERRTPIGTVPPIIPRAHGGEFRGQVPGQGHGMQDNVYMPIKDKGKQVGTLAVSPSEYVVDSYTMSALGNGNPDAGAKVMDGVVESVRKKAYGTVRQPNEIDGLQALRPMIERV